MLVLEMMMVFTAVRPDGKELFLMTVFNDSEISKGILNPKLDENEGTEF